MFYCHLLYIIISYLFYPVTTELCSHVLGRQFIRIYHQSLDAIGQAITDAAFFILYFDSAVTTAHLVLISLLGHVYNSCSQHLHRTGSSYQYIKTDPTLLTKISVILVLYLGDLVTISFIFLYFHMILLKLSYQL